MGIRHARDGTTILDWTDGRDHGVRAQLEAVAELPVVGPHVAAMPDAHVGIGATVGSVIPTRGAIIPAAVGTDIGCGMVAVRTHCRAGGLPDSLRPLRDAIEAVVPVGKRSHAEPPKETPATAALEERWRRIVDRTPALGLRGKGRRPAIHWSLQRGTLGGGNHFIELCLDEEGWVWVMLHSGSRNPGTRIASWWIERAKEQRRERDGRCPGDAALSWLDEGTPAFDGYVEALGWAQDFAAESRSEMLRRVLAAAAGHLGPDATPADVAVSCHHNYVARERHGAESLWVTRKGAINADRGRLGIIPGSMGARSYIVRGRGEATSFRSAAHGAGRRMSRTEAKQRFGAAEVEAQTRGVECRKDRGVADEAPGAYKDIDDVMRRQEDLVEVVARLKQVLCVKG